MPCFYTICMQAGKSYSSLEMSMLRPRGPRVGDKWDLQTQAYTLKLHRTLMGVAC
jgi:hypothetical protein